jgi:V8-like Glu-specific endopeptidase
MRHATRWGTLVGLLVAGTAGAQAPAIIGAQRAMADTNVAQRSSGSIEIATPDAAYVKVNFSAVDLLPGVVLEVSNPDGSEVYRYTADKRDEFTVDESLGQNGKSSFSAMSISGPVAIVRVLGKGESRAASRVVIGSFYEGYPDPAMPELKARGLLTPRGVAQTKSICGVDDKRDAACYSTGSLPGSRSAPIARLLISGSSLCTGWRVGAGDRMLTNNHCFRTSSQARATEVWFNYQRTTCGGTTNATTTKVAGSSVLRTSSTYDYTLFTVASPSTISGFGFLSLDVRAPVTNEGIFIVQHPAGRPKQIGWTSDRDGSAGCRVNVASATGGATGSDLGYFCDTEGGSSGSPVLARSSGKVIGLHHLGGCTNQGVRIDKIWPQISSYFSGVP